MRDMIYDGIIAEIFLEIRMYSHQKLTKQKQNNNNKWNKQANKKPQTYDFQAR